MKLSEFKKKLEQVNALHLQLPNGDLVPAHFHITEAGLTTKHFIDCGGTIRTEKNANLQVWVANDTAHRLDPKKLLRIIDISSPLFGKKDLDVEIEYQGETIGRYGIVFSGNAFRLTSKATACLASENCGTTDKNEKVMAGAEKQACCTPGGGCC